MIDLLFIALMQAAAGAPTTPAADQPQQQTQQQPQQVLTGTNRPDGQVLRCRREPVLGTRLTRRVCMTDQERQQIENDSREQLQHMQRTGGTNAG